MQQSEFKKSPKLEKQIKEVRSTPSKEASAKLRMEAVIANAELIKLSLDLINSNPSISYEELVSKLNKSGKILFPKKIEEFVNLLLYKKFLVDQILEAAKQKGSETDLAQTLLKSLYPQKLLPVIIESHDINFVKFPFSVVLELSPKIFKIIFPTEGVTGSHFDYKTFYLKQRETDTGYLGAPLIITKIEPSLDTLEHEKAHEEYSSIKSALSKSADKEWGYHQTTWGSWRNILSAREAKDKLLEKTKKLRTPSTNFQRLASAINRGLLGLIPMNNLNALKNMEREITKTREFKLLVEYGLSKAKDEILAELRPEAVTGVNYIQFLTEYNSDYDYFQKSLNIPKNSILHNVLWTDYIKQLKENTNHAFELFNKYKYIPEWENRLKIFRFVLFQWPLQEWNKQLERAGFIEEMKLYFEISDQIDKYWNFFDKGELFLENISGDERILLKVILDIFNSGNDSLKKEYQTSQLDILQENKSFLEFTIAKYIENSSLAQKIKLYEQIKSCRNNITNKLRIVSSYPQILPLIKEAENIFFGLLDFILEKKLLTIQRLEDDLNKLNDILKEIEQVSF